MTQHAHAPDRRKGKVQDVAPARPQPASSARPPKFRVGGVDDAAERVADDVAASVVAALAGRADGGAHQEARAAQAEAGQGTTQDSRIRRATYQPDTLTTDADAEPATRIRRALAVTRSADPTTIHRYFVHTPRAGRVTGKQFQAQQKADGAASFVDAATGKTTVTEPASKRPPLRVSDDGRIAIEDSDLKSRQAKVLYAEPSVVRQSNARLLETGSKYQLFMEQASAVRVPSKDGAPLHELARVLPRNVRSYDAETDSYTDEGLKMDVQATCDEVAQAIANTGNIGDFPLLKKSIATAIGFGELNTAAYMLARAKNATPDEAVVAASDALKLGPQHDAERQRRVDERFRDGDAQSLASAKFMLDNNIVPTDEEREENDKKTKLRMAGAVKADMEREIKEDIKDAYGKMLVKRPRLANQLSAELGINKHAAPEVGQAFGSIQMQAKDKRDWKTGKQRTVAEGGSWGSHYGAVVAKSGGDSVTLENYARNRENEGISDATSAMYYFQMYGTEKGQTWHEAWANADRRVVNPLTQVMGQPHQNVWTAQLANLPKLTSIGDDAGYAAALAGHQQAVRDAATRDDSMAAYQHGLLSLVHRRFQRYAGAAFDAAVDAGLAEFTEPFQMAYAPVMAKFDAWIAKGAAAPRPKGPKRLLSKKSSTPALQIEVLRRLRDAIADVRGYYSDRFPAEELDKADRAAPQRRAPGPNLKPQQAAALDQKVKDYFVANLDDVAKYDVVKERGASYAGEEVDATNNPMISQGRTAVNNFRREGKSDAEIRSALQATFPSYSDADIDTYFLATNTPRVAYLESTDRTDYQLTASGSKLKQRGTDFDTSGMFSNGAGAGFSIFVMSPRGELYANQHRPGLFHHSSFLAGLPTAAAGELQVKKGKLTKLTNKSGHYHPGAAETYQALKELKSYGIPLSSFALSIKSIPSDDPEAQFNDEYKSARDFAESFEKSRTGRPAK